MLEIPPMAVVEVALGGCEGIVNRP